MKTTGPSARFGSYRALIISGIALCALGLAACAHSGGRPDVDPEAESAIFSGIVSVYRGPLNHLAGVRRGSCPMYPSCSEYSRQAVAAHGAVVGWIMSMDRLMRCGRSELQTAPRVYIDGQWKTYDPLEANDGWWQAQDHHSSKRFPDIH